MHRFRDKRAGRLPVASDAIGVARQPALFVHGHEGKNLDGEGDEDYGQSYDREKKNFNGVSPQV